MDEKAFKSYSFTEIFDIEEIQKIQDLFSIATGVAGIITETDGTPITKPSGFCSFCNDVVRKTEKGLKNCMLSDAIIGSPNTDGPRVQRCLSGGLLDGGVSVIVEGKHIANWLIGQVLDEDVELEDLLPYADAIGADLDVYMTALKKVKHMSKEQFDDVSNLLYMYVGQLSKYAINNITLSEELDEKNINEIKLTLKYNEHLEEINAELEETNSILEEEIAEREKADNEIIELNKSLEIKVKERTIKLEELMTSLEEEIADRSKVEEALLRENSFIEALFESMPGYIFVYDMEGNLVRWNKKHEDMTGYSSEELAKMTMKDWFDEEDIIRVAAAIEDIFEKGYGEVEAYLLRKDNSKLHVRSTGVPLTIDGKTYFAGIGIDITEQKINEQKLIDSDARHKAMIANISDVIGIVDVAGIIRYKSPNITQWFGWEPEELIGESYIKTVHIDDQRYVEAVFNNLLGKPNAVEKIEYRYRCKDGKCKSVKLTAINLIDNPYINGILINYHDITERKINEKRISEARAASEAKSTFLANMSHEIRTPLNAIIGTNYLMNKTDLTGVQKDYVHRITLSAENLLSHVNNVLDFSKIEANKLSLENKVFDLYEVLNNVANVVKYNLYNKQLKLQYIVDYNTPQFLNGDAHRLSQILLNLVNNAIKFTEHGKILISVEKESIDQNKVQIKFTIKDTGIGMNKEQQENIFGAFSQADMSTTRKYGGTGLGLTITRNLIELMEGDISLKSQLGYGSEFMFNVKFECIESIEIGEKQEDDYAEFEFLNILIVSDKSDSISNISKELEELGVSVDYVNSFSEALIKLKDTQAYNMIFVGNNLLSRNMLDIDEQINDLRIKGKMKIILITDCIESRLESFIRDNDFDYIVYNPIGKKQLFKQLKYILEGDYESGINNSYELDHNMDDHVLNGMDILLVEDNEVNREIVIIILEEYGAIIHSAENGVVALDMASEVQYDMILMDLQMPILDGYNTTIRIREMDSYKETPIIAMSAHAISGVSKRVREAGMNDYISKPFDVDKMIEKLTAWGEKIVAHGD
jgi:PAS domain S-box-containing protein